MIHRKDWNNEWINMITMAENLEQTTIRIENENSKVTIHWEEFGKTHEDTWGDLDTSERREPELIWEYLSSFEKNLDQHFKKELNPLWTIT